MCRCCRHCVSYLFCCKCCRSNSSDDCCGCDSSDDDEPVTSGNSTKKPDLEFDKISNRGMFVTSASSKPNEDYPTEVHRTAINESAATNSEWDLDNHRSSVPSEKMDNRLEENIPEPDYD